MSKLLQSIEKPQQAKVAYQSYILEHGIERLTVLVPVKEASKFEASFNAMADRSKKQIAKLVESFNGKVKDNG
jgi:hypothetical protein